MDENDVLRDQGEAYAGKLRDAGVPTTSVRFNGTIHDFMRLNALRDSESTRAAISLAVAALRRAFGGHHRPVTWARCGRPAAGGAAEGPSAPRWRRRGQYRGSSRRSLVCHDATELASPKLVCLGIGGLFGSPGSPKLRKERPNRAALGSRSMPHSWRRHDGLRQTRSRRALSTSNSHHKAARSAAASPGGHVTPVQHSAQVSLADQHVTRMEVTMESRLGRSRLLPGVRR